MDYYVIFQVFLDNSCVSELCSSHEFEGYSSNPSNNVRDLFRYVPPPPRSQPRKKKNIPSYFTPSPTSTSASQPSQTQPTLDNHWKKQYKDATFEYTTR
jgi:hypothetical protein